MKVTVYPSIPKGTLKAIPSKSMAHRLLICAALSDGVSKVRCESSSEDIDATVNCLRAMGSNIVKIGNIYLVPKATVHPGQSVTLDCNESGTTLRFMMCVAAGLGLCARFKGSDRLFERPLSILEEVLTEHGIVISRDENNRIIQSGRAFGNDYSISGNVSSQFISGLLLMLPLCFGKKIGVTGDFESKPYVDLTVSALRQSGVEISEEGNTYSVNGKYNLTNCEVEGDWSNSAFWFLSGALGGSVKVTGLCEKSAQGDREMMSYLMSFGAEKRLEDTGISFTNNILKATSADVSNTPDLVPALAVVAALSEGKTEITGAKRLKLKESDRLKTVTDMINNLGGRCEYTEDRLIIHGVKKLTGGTVSACNDHRIVMAASVAAVCCEGPVIIEGAQAVNKSYPGFFDDLRSLGVRIEVEE